MCVRVREKVCVCQERVYGRDRRKKERCGCEYISMPSRANEKFLQRKVGYCIILDERADLRQVLKCRKTF